MKTRLLEADPDLAGYLPPDSLRALTPKLIAEVVELPAGEWLPTRIEPHPGHLGYMVLEGVLLRLTSVNGSAAAN